MKYDFYYSDDFNMDPYYFDKHGFSIIVNGKRLAIVMDKRLKGLWTKYKYLLHKDDKCMCQDLNIKFEDIYNELFNTNCWKYVHKAQDPNLIILNIAAIQNYGNASDDIAKDLFNEQLNFFWPYIEKWIVKQLSESTIHQEPLTTQLFWKHGRELTEEDKAKIADILG